MTASSSGKLDSLSVFLDGSNRATNVWVALYTSSSGHPGKLLSQAATLSPISGKWNTVPIPAVQVQGGTQYWVALLGLNGLVQVRDSTGSCLSGRFSETSWQANLRSLPAVWSTGSQWATCVVSAFGSGIISGGVSVTVSPATVSLLTGKQAQFKATVSGTGKTSVTWTTYGGSVTSSGLYTAPSSAGTYTVVATSIADPSKSGSAAVTVSLSGGVSVSVSPTSVALLFAEQQQFTAYVSGTGNTAATWSASGGTVTTAGLYTAPSLAGTYTVTAVSVADPTKSAFATVGVSPPPPIVVTISPVTVVVPEKAQQQFVATVSGSSNHAVTWAVTGGNGTVTQSGLYTAPQAVETDAVTARSQADPTRSASATITVAVPHSVSLRWSPSISSGVSYSMYRGNSTGGPYTLLKGSVSSTSYVDLGVLAGRTYYYVATAVDSSGRESVPSGEVQAVIPTP